jgi:hypothetical protein
VVAEDCQIVEAVGDLGMATAKNRKAIDEDFLAQLRGFDLQEKE